MTAGKPYSAACDRNRDPILGVLRRHFADRRSVLEIGSGTGQHAVHFAAAMPHLVWQTSEREEYLDGVRPWLAEAALPNTPPPLVLDVAGEWPPGPFDAVFTANTLHIMSASDVEVLFAGLRGAATPAGTVLAIYGPFNVGGRHTSDSNAAFDAMLRARDPASGLRDLEWVDGLARAAGYALRSNEAMPANNRCVVWARD